MYLGREYIPNGTEPFAPRTYSYDYTEYNFWAAMARIFRTAGLDRIGATEADSIPLLSREADQSTPYHKMYYAAFEREVQPVYRRFVTNVIAPCMAGPFIYQKVPTFRISLPGNVAVGEFHTDGDYSHQEGEVNFWLPVTNAGGSNSVYVETYPGSKIMEPASLILGEVMVFDAVRSRHGNHINTTDRTRVSIDFRVILKSVFKPSGLRSVNTGTPMDIGGYFVEGPDIDSEE